VLRRDVESCVGPRYSHFEQEGRCLLVKYTRQVKIAFTASFLKFNNAEVLEQHAFCVIRNSSSNK
jgi:hypothetical protein